MYGFVTLLKLLVFVGEALELLLRVGHSVNRQKDSLFSSGNVYYNAIFIIDFRKCYSQDVKSKKGDFAATALKLLFPRQMIYKEHPVLV